MTQDVSAVERPAVVVLLSGGINSTVLLYSLRARGVKVLALTIDWGQPYRHEIVQAIVTSARLKIPHRVLIVQGIKAMLPIIVGEPVKLPADTQPLLLLSLAATWAVAGGIKAVAYGADVTMAPDVFRLLADRIPVQVIAPFLYLPKSDIIKVMSEIGVLPIMMWSCVAPHFLTGQLPRHCGVCVGCATRRRAFQQAGVLDTTEYEEAK